MTSRGDKIVYRCLAGRYYDAEVRVVRLDGRVDIAVDAGSSEPVELTRITVVDKVAHLPGTCAVGTRETL